MTRLLPASLLAQLFLFPLTAQAQTAVPKAEPPAMNAPAPTSASWLVDPRIAPQSGEHDLLRFGIHGEYAVRYGSVPDLRLDDYGFDDYRRKLGQTHRLEHYLRFSPRLTYRRNVTLVAQFDLPRGMFLGQSTDHVQSDPEPLNERQPMQFVGRYLYVDFAIPNGHITVGQQPACWGMGLVDDSGDQRQFFGDPRYGTLVDRVAYTGRPLGAKQPWELLVAMDFVFSDGRTSALDGDRTVRAVVGNSYVISPESQVGLLILAQRSRPHFDDRALERLAPKETTFTFDLSGQTTLQVPGVGAKLFAGTETALVVGKTAVGTNVLAPGDATVSRVGALARVGVLQSSGKAGDVGGPLGLALEWGFASGDADPTDGTDRRFTMNPGRRIGLVLFDEALRWKTARSATALNDPRLGQRAVSSSWALPSAGGVFGATYLSAQFLYRPVTKFDLRAAATIAQSTADFVDPTQSLVRGHFSNFDGGDATHRDLGLELDAATEYRMPLENGLVSSLGVEAAVLFPGKAFADAAGSPLGRQQLVRGRFGFYF